MNDSTDSDTDSADSDPVPTSRSDAASASGASADAPKGRDAASTGVRPVEIGGQKGPDPTRYGDWERNGRCTDF